MTKHLFNYCTIDWYENDMIAKGTTLRDFTKEFDLDGIEQFIYTMERPGKSYKDLTTGVHLNYWPYWMDFWLKKAKRLKQQFRNVIERNQYFRDALSREEWLSVIRRNIGAALTEAPEYMVWHVAEANNEEIFTWEFNYSDREVLTACADVFNSVADEIPENVTVLFENLWWPGLRLTDPRNVKYFFERIERKNVGIMLDTGHLMNTNNRLKTEEEAADYVCRVYEKLGSCAELVKGVHLSCSLSGQYQRIFDRRVPANLDSAMIWQHVAAIDTHKPFETEAARKILQCINPEYVVHEFTYDNMDDLRNKLTIQLENCR
ncbi:MAG: TIM barrel protein [Phascolarctobacterium sp.]|nr:TIM barrel protein [Phascolarctobacterium sp.]